MNEQRLAAQTSSKEAEARAQSAETRIAAFQTEILQKQTLVDKLKADIVRGQYRLETLDGEVSRLKRMEKKTTYPTIKMLSS